MGATVALDDFGAGLSSFAYLRRMEVDYLKIDGLFVKHMHSDARGFAMARSIMEVARIHNMRAIAEFVHKPVIVDLLREMGIDYAQGYAPHEPEPLLG